MARAPFERRLPEVGRIRLGMVEEVPGRKPRPRASETLVFSSSSSSVLGQLHRVVGGELSDWPGGADPYRLVSAVDHIDVTLLPRLFEEPRWELWSAAGCLRRCDGQTCFSPRDTPDGPVMEEGPCQCTDDEGECRITTRLQVLLPWVGGVGAWMVTTHSRIAAQELSGQAWLLRAMGRSTVPAVLAVERVRVRGRLVPVLRLRSDLAIETGELPLPLEGGER